MSFVPPPGAPTRTIVADQTPGTNREQPNQTSSLHCPVSTKFHTLRHPTTIPAKIGDRPGSAVSGLASTALFPSKRRAEETESDASPSPKKATPDFSKPHCDNNLLRSNDNEDRWADEEQHIMVIYKQQNADEDVYWPRE